MVADRRPVKFADLLLDPLHQPVNSPLIGLMEAVGKAASSLQLNVFHCACQPSVPLDPTQLTDQLASLSDGNVIVVLFVDPSLWPTTDTTRSPEQRLVEIVMESDKWKGPAIVPGLHEKATGALPRTARPIICLAVDVQEAAARLQQVFSVEQGRIMKSGTLRVPSSNESPPVLRGVGRDRD